MAKDRYRAIIEKLFFDKYVEGAHEVDFDRDDIVAAALALGVAPPKNLGDVVYSYRYRNDLPPAIAAVAPPDAPYWVIRSRGAAEYRFCAVRWNTVTPSPNRSITKIPDSTPGFIERKICAD